MRGGLRVIRTDRGSAERLEKKFLRSAPLLRTGYTCGGDFKCRWGKLSQVWISSSSLSAYGS